MYRARFDERRREVQAHSDMYAEAAGGCDTDDRAWLIFIAQPRRSRVGRTLSANMASDIMTNAEELSLTYAGRAGVHPLESVDRFNPRHGLRRWVFANTAAAERMQWRQAGASLHQDGSVTLAASIGGHRTSSDGYNEGWQIESAAIECAIADAMALL
jgi:hypothetical protein